MLGQSRRAADPKKFVKVRTEWRNSNSLEEQHGSEIAVYSGNEAKVAEAFVADDPIIPAVP
jgi:hypothetical protein